MYQIDNSTAAVSQPASTAAGSAGFFTDGNPATSTPATIVPAEWLNSVMMELINVVNAGGVTPTKNQFNNVLSAIRRIGQNTVILADTGAVNAYTATNATPLVAGTWVDGVVQAVKIAHANTGASTYAPDGLTAIPIYGLGLQPLQGGELALNGIAILVRMTIPGVNSGNPIAVLMECAGGAQQVAPATQSQHAPQMGQVAGVVGSVRNLVMSVTAASASATLTADEIIVETALGGVRYCLPAFSKTINLATTGAGGMDTGSAPASGYVALYAIYNPTTQTAALLATNATAAVQPNVYGGANMPAGYTASALVSVWPMNGSGQFVVGYQSDRTVYFVNTVVLNNTTVTGSYTSLSISAAVPKNAKSCGGYNSVTNTAAGTSTIAIATNSAGVGAVESIDVSSGAGSSGAAAGFSMVISTPQTIFYNAVGANTTFNIQISSYAI